MSWVDQYKTDHQKVGGKPCKYNTAAQKIEYREKTHLNDYDCDSYGFRNECINKSAKRRRIVKSY